MENIPEQSDFAGLRIVIYGPESTGKSTLATQLAEHYKVSQVPEFARDFLQDKYDLNGHICTYEDIMPIAIGQRKAENRASSSENKLLICDTDLLETAVYSAYYFNRVPKALEDAVRNSAYDLYLLMDIDTPWSPDDLRDRPNDRKKLFNRFEEALQKYDRTYVLISKLGNQRLLNAIAAIDNLNT